MAGDVGWREVEVEVEVWGMWFWSLGKDGSGGVVWSVGGWS